MSEITLGEYYFLQNRAETAELSGLERGSAIHGVFLENFHVRVTVGDIYAITEIPEVEEPDWMRPVPANMYDYDLAVTMTVTGGIDYEMARNAALPIRYGSTGVSTEESLKTIIGQRLPLEAIAEIEAINGYIEFVNVSDIQRANDNINEYINLVNRRIKVELHYSPPPEEDMVKLKGLSSSLAKALKRINGGVNPGSGFGVLRPLLFGSSSNYYKPESDTREPQGEHMAERISSPLDYLSDANDGMYGFDRDL